MIYLIKQPSWTSGISYFKVGYASDLEKRLIQYEYHCPQTERVSSRLGEVQEEFLIHRYLHRLPFVQKFLKSEWYEVLDVDSDKFIEEFSRDYEDMEEEILKDLSGISITLYEYLSKKYPDNLNIKTYKLSEIDTICLLNKETSENPDLPEEIRNFFKDLFKMRKISDRLKHLCEYDLPKETISVIVDLLPDTDKVKYFYTALGPERCKALYYSPKKISSELGIKYFPKEEVSKAVYKEFDGILKLPLSEIKSKLKTAYDRIGYDKTPKAIDIKEFYNISEYTMVDKVSGKRVRGYNFNKKLL